MVLGASNNLFTIRVVTDKVETIIPKGEQPASADKGTNARMMLDAASEGTGRLQQTSSSAEGRWILALGATIVLATVVVMGEESWLDSWTGIATVVAVNFLGLFVLWRRATSRTVRPRYFTLTLWLSAAWAGVAIAISTSIFEGVEVNSASLMLFILAGLVTAAPVLACGVWLLVRGR